MWKRKSISLAWHILNGVVVSLVQFILLGWIGFDFNREQEAQQHMCMKLLLSGTLIYLLTCGYIVARRTPTPGDLWFIRNGVALPLLLELVGLLL